MKGNIPIYFGFIDRWPHREAIDRNTSGFAGGLLSFVVVICALRLVRMTDSIQ